MLTVKKVIAGCLAGLIVGVSILLVMKMYKGKRASPGRVLPNARTLQIVREVQFRHWSHQQMGEEEIERLWSTSVGRSELCDAVGQSALNGLEDKSYVAVLKVLARQGQVDRVCLKAVVKRLDEALVMAKMLAGHDVPVDPSHDLEIYVLRMHPFDVAEVIKDEYALGTEHAQDFAVPLLMAVKGRASCADIVATIKVLRKDGDLFAGSFPDARDRLCR